MIDLGNLEDAGGILVDTMFRQHSSVLWMRSPVTCSQWDRGRPVFLVREINPLNRVALVLGRSRADKRRWVTHVIRRGKWDCWRSIDVPTQFAETNNLHGASRLVRWGYGS